MPLTAVGAPIYKSRKRPASSPGGGNLKKRRARQNSASRGICSKLQPNCGPHCRGRLDSTTRLSAVLTRFHGRPPHHNVARIEMGVAASLVAETIERNQQLRGELVTRTPGRTPLTSLPTATTSSAASRWTSGVSLLVKRIYLSNACGIGIYRPVGGGENQLRAALPINPGCYFTGWPQPARPAGGCQGLIKKRELE